MKTCPHCGRVFPKLTKDHIVPRSFGGANHQFNLRKICGECNVKRSSRMTIGEMIEMGKHPPLTIFRHVRTIPLEQFQRSIEVIQSFGVPSHHWIPDRKQRRAYKRAQLAFAYMYD